MYCTEADLKQYLLAAYLDAAKGQNPGIVGEQITRVSGQIDDYIGERYTLPLPSVPSRLNWAASVIVAYRILGGITSLVSTEGQTSNEFVFLQGEYKRALAYLDDIAAGKSNLFPAPAEDNQERQDDRAFLVAAPERRFNDDLLGRY